MAFLEGWGGAGSGCDQTTRGAWSGRVGGAEELHSGRGGVRGVVREEGGVSGERRGGQNEAGRGRGRVQTIMGRV